MSELHVIKFEADLELDEAIKVDSDEVTEGKPDFRRHSYYESDTESVRTGVFESRTPITTKLHSRTATEFMHIVEGSVHIIDKKGNEETFSAGESLIMPSGMQHIWKQTEPVRKFYYAFEESSGGGVDDPDSLKITRIDHDVSLSEIPVEDTSRIDGVLPTWHLHHYFTDPSERMNIGIWGTTVFHEVPWTTDHPELMHIIEGSVTFTNGAGVTMDFKAGDTLLAPTGMNIKWDSEAYVKKIYCAVSPGK